MLFQFTTFNHCPQGKIIIEDITRIMGNQLMELGHEVRWTEEVEFISGSQVYNIVIESFADDPATIERIALAYKNGCRFIYVATEEPTEKGFNHGLDPAMIDRQNAFPEAAKYVDGILHLIPGQHVTDWYGQFAPTAYAELGYAPALDVGDGGVEPECDFGFYGKMTWRREEILGHLQSLTSTPILRLTDFWTPRLERDRVMRKARVIVQIRANLEYGLVSSTRCATALNFGRPVIAEPHSLSAPWDKVVHFSSSLAQFYKDALAVAGGNWRRLHELQLYTFRAKLTPEVCIDNPLRQIGVL